MDTQTIGVLLIVLGAVVGLVSLFVMKVTSRAKKMPPEKSYANSVDKGFACYGPYYEHGMVTDINDPKKVRAQSKKSHWYYESFI
jgi:hypothetical protein